MRPISLPLKTHHLYPNPLVLGLTWIQRLDGFRAARSKLHPGLWWAEAPPSGWRGGRVQIPSQALLPSDLVPPRRPQPSELKGLLPNKQASAAGSGVYMTKPFQGGRFLDAPEIAPQNTTLKQSPPIKNGGRASDEASLVPLEKVWAGLRIPAAHQKILPEPAKTLTPNFLRVP